MSEIMKEWNNLTFASSACLEDKGRLRNMRNLNEEIVILLGSKTIRIAF